MFSDAFVTESMSVLIAGLLLFFCLFVIIYFSFCIYNAAVNHVETCCFVKYFWKGKLEFALVAILEDFLLTKFMK